MLRYEGRRKFGVHSRGLRVALAATLTPFHVLQTSRVLHISTNTPTNEQTVKYTAKNPSPNDNQTQ